MPARLVPLTAGVAPTIPLQRPLILIGRHPDCDLRINLPQVSRRHCVIALAYDRLLIRDLGSRNGVRVNGRQVEEAQLRTGDELAIAQLLYRLEETVATPSRPTAPPPPAPAAPKAPPRPNDGDLMPLD